MSRPVYSTQLIAVELSGTSSFDFEIPDELVCVVRDISGTISTGAGSDTVGASASCFTADTQFWGYNYPGAFVGPFHWEGRVVSPGPGFVTFYLAGGSDAGASVVVSGYLLTP